MVKYDLRTRRFVCYEIIIHSLCGAFADFIFDPNLCFYVYLCVVNEQLVILMTRDVHLQPKQEKKTN